MNNDYGENFSQNIQRKVQDEKVRNEKIQNEKARVAWATVVVLMVVVLIETIALSIILVNNSRSIEGLNTDNIDEEVTPQDYDVEVGEDYDEEGNIVALEQTCTMTDGSKYVFTYNKDYQHYNADGSLADSGNYDLANNSLVAIKNADGTTVERVLYYDGYSVADGLTLFECDEQEQ